MTETEVSFLEHLNGTAQIIPNVFQTMLEVEAQPLAESVPFAAEHPVVASIHLSGAWHGAVLLQFEKETAFQMAERMMGISKPSFVDDDVRDTLGELLNMTAGNLKALAPGPTSSSMPSVVEGTKLSYRLLGDNRSRERCFETELGRFQVTLVETQADD